MNFFNFKSRFLKFLIIGTSVSFSLASHANSCLHFYSYKHQDPFIWQRESRPYFDAVSLIEGKNVHPFYAAKIKNKHRILQAHVDAKNLTQNIMEAFYRERYFAAVMPQLRVALVIYSSLKLAKSTTPLTKEQYYSEISNMFQEVIFPILTNEKGELTSDVKLHLQTVLSQKNLYPYEDKAYSLFDRIADGYQAKWANHLDFQEKRLAQLFPQAPHSFEMKYAHSMDGILNMLYDLGIKAKQIPRMQKAQSQLTLVFQAGDKGFSETNVFKPRIIVKALDKVAVVLEQSVAGWHYRVLNAEQMNELNDPNVKQRKFFKLSFAN